MSFLDLANLVSTDTECTGLALRHGAMPFMVTTTNPEGGSNCWEWDVNPKTRIPKVKKQDLVTLANHIEGKRLVFHHAKFDIRALTTIGVYLHFPESEWPESCDPWVLAGKPKGGTHINCEGWEDTLPASHIHSSKGTHKLKELALMYFDYPETDEEEILEAVKKLTGRAKSLGYKVARKRSGKKTVPEYEADYWLPKVFDPNSTLCRTYGTKDTERTMLLWLKVYLPMIQEDKTLRRCYLREKNLIPVIYAMEHGGISASSNSLKVYEKRLNDVAIPARQRAEAIAAKRLKRKTFNIDSGKQMIELLYTDPKGFKLPIIEYTEKENPSTSTGSEEKPGTLIKLRNDYVDEGTPEHEFLSETVKSRKYNTGVRYIVRYKSIALPHPTDRTRSCLYFTTNPNATDTTRSNCDGGQNISKRAESPLRNVFSPPEGKVWIPIDYSQLQLRIFAAVTKAQTLIQSFRDGYDFHATVATGIFKKPHDKISKLERRIAKNTNFALIFGAGAAKVNNTAGIPDAYERFNKQYPMVHDFLQGAIKSVRQTGQVVTPFGYPLEVDKRNAYAGGNYIIQGCEGDIIKNAMVIMVKLGLIDFIDYRIVLLVHDELIIECPEKYDKLRIRKIMGVMEYAGEMLDMETPVEASIVETNWGRAKDLPLKPIKPNGKLCREIIYGQAI